MLATPMSFVITAPDLCVGRCAALMYLVFTLDQWSIRRSGFKVLLNV